MKKTVKKRKLSVELLTLHYHPPIKSNDNEIVLEKVCKTMFLNTFSISNDFVYTALQKNHECSNLGNFIDGRGTIQTVIG